MRQHTNFKRHPMPRRVSVNFAGGALLVDGATYEILVPIKEACRLKRVTLSAGIKIAGGTNTLAVLKNNSTTVLSGGATISPITYPAAANVPEEIALVSTESTRVLASGDFITCKLVCGTMTTDGRGYCLELEFE